MTGTFLISENKPQKFFIIVYWAIIAYSLYCKKFHLLSYLYLIKSLKHKSYIYIAKDEKRYF